MSVSPKRFARGLTAWALFLGSGALMLQAQPPHEVEIIFDSSRSMNDLSGAQTKLEAAKKALTTVMGQIEAGANVGLRVFGHHPVYGDISEACRDSHLVMPIQPIRKEDMIASVYVLQAYGQTPIGYSLQLAANDFSPSPEVGKTILLISDGEESCGMDPIQVVETLKAKGIQIVIQALGFAVDQKTRAQLTRLAEMTGGKYVDAQNAAELEKQLVLVAQAAGIRLKPGRGQGIDILAASSGARIVNASKESFAEMTDGNEKEIFQYFGAGDEVIYSFKDNQGVLLEKFAVPVFQERRTSVGQIDLFGSLTAPDRGFFPIGTLQIQNKVFFGNVYQEFTIDPSKAVRYLKVVLGPSSGGDSLIYMHEWKAYGTYLSAEELQARIAETLKADRNLLAAENGGQLIAATETTYQYLIDGTDDSAGYAAKLPLGSEGIFGFEGGKTAVLKSVAIPIFEASPENVKTVEIWTSITSPTDGFTKAGGFETTNLVFAGDPYQEYKFEQPVTAKYLKVKVLESHGASQVKFAELQAMGALES